MLQRSKLDKALRQSSDVTLDGERGTTACWRSDAVVSDTLVVVGLVTRHVVDTHLLTATHQHRLPIPQHSRRRTSGHVTLQYDVIALCRSNVSTRLVRRDLWRN